MKRTIYKCDRCGKEAETNEDQEALCLGQLTLAFEPLYSSGGPARVYPPHKMWQQEWCRKCRAEVGVVSEMVKKADRGGEPVVTLETVIREMIQQEMENKQ